MYGILTGDPSVARSGVGDVTYFLAERTDGTRREPVEDTVTTVCCFGDTMTVEHDPERAAVAADGTRSTPTAEGHHWGTVCPTDPGYRAALLERLEDLGDVRLSTCGFPGTDFCHCERCERLFRESGHDDRMAWRCDVITSFVAAASERVTGDISVTLYPDPHPGGLVERQGLSLERVVEHVDGVLVPLCGDYGTPYWVETLASGFGRRLADCPVETTIQLSVADSSVGTLADVTRMVEPHCDTVVYGTFPGDLETVRAVIGRRRGTAISA